MLADLYPTDLPALGHLLRIVPQPVLHGEAANLGPLPQRHRPVDEVEVEVVQLEVLEGGLAGQ